MNSGELLKEVEEDIHQEEWWAFWKTYGPLIAICVTVTLLATGGYLWWRSQAQAKREEESLRYEEALTSLETKGPNTEAQEIFEHLATHASSGYATLAHLQLFRLNTLRAKTDAHARGDAMRRGRNLLEFSQKNRELGLEGIMILNLAALALNTQESIAEDIGQRLPHYDVPQNPWKGLTLEMQGLQKLASQDRLDAQKVYTHVLSSSEVGQGVHMRASMEMIGTGLPFPERAS